MNNVLSIVLQTNCILRGKVRHHMIHTPIISLNPIVQKHRSKTIFFRESDIGYLQSRKESSTPLNCCIGNVSSSRGNNVSTKRIGIRMRQV